MNTKKLINKMVELIDAINSLENQLNEVKKDNAEIRAKLNEVEAKLQNQTPVFEENNYMVQEGFKVYEDIAEPQSETEPETVNIPVNVVTLEDNMLEYGSVIIGKVVQESIKYANLISASTGENKKEVLNLIMGKAEVVKSEIFTITDGELSAEVKKELIDTQLAEAIDYFKSAYGQLTQ